MVPLQARLWGCSIRSQATLGCWPSHPAQPPALGTPLGGCRAVLSLLVLATGAAGPFPRDTSQQDEDGATPWSRECGTGLPQPVSLRMLFITLHVSQGVCGCSCPMLASRAPWSCPQPQPAWGQRLPHVALWGRKPQQQGAREGCRQRRSSVPILTPREGWWPFSIPVPWVSPAVGGSHGPGDSHPGSDERWRRGGLWPGGCFKRARDL